MKKILFTALLAAFTAANDYLVGAFTNEGSPFALVNNPRMFVNLIYKMDFGYRLQNSLDHIDNGIIDSWLEVGLYSYGHFEMQVNILDLGEYYF